MFKGQKFIVLGRAGIHLKSGSTGCRKCGHCCIKAGLRLRHAFKN